ncbi:MAG: SGNH/GDSL hydrolase family protein [Clostridia bacterium]|nr:SGNH/GDSL hydrolase family protein [Clostridia bacterium]
MKTFLFQGDSITDAGRIRENEFLRGSGYPTLVSAELMYERPGEFSCINRGVSGNRIVDLYARIKRDLINLKPDYLSILIGVNDVWHEYTDDPNGVSDDKYRRIYDMMIEEIRAELPGIRIYILEPFVLKGTVTEAKWEDYDREVRLRARSAKWIAEKYNLPFLPLQDRFDAACEKCEPSYWLWDGVHPTAPGHELIARALFEEVKKDI